MISQELLAQAIAEAYKLAKQESQAHPSNAQENAQEGPEMPSGDEQ